MMSHARRAFTVFLSVCLLLPLLMLPIHGENSISAPSVSAESAILMDAVSGTVLFEKNAGEMRPMASTTKIMTALVALETMPLSTVITVDKKAVGVEGSSVYLCEGERLTLEQLLYALLLESANDAATAIAIGVAGSVESFADLMNQRAAELGLEHTCFQNPHGLDHEAHYTTARELGMITAQAMKNPAFVAMVSTRKTTIPHNGTEGVRLLVNHNKLLRSYGGAIGVKTGFTKRSGRCLVSAAERNGVTLIAVTLNAPDDWRDHTALLDYGFSRMETVRLCEAHEVCMPLPVVGGRSDAVFISNPHPLSLALPKGHAAITRAVEAPRFLFAGVEAGDTVGALVYFCDLNGDGSPERIAETALVAQSTVEKKRPKRGFWNWLRSLLGG